jgi:hypothetical protein
MGPHGWGNRRDMGGDGPSSPWTRRDVAINPATPDALLTIALEDAELDVCKNLVWRPNVSASVVDRLAADPEPEVRACWRRARDRLAAKLGSSAYARPSAQAL